ncbi:Uncharacterised protein [Chryseobacterium nakagawai]|uniref:Uncharacterized protein n=1 Tax=Chryseobacterium nakagawai TaxID=1241982 RepID=A0AAD1DS06_CHRNA|nr:hypothetical protein [Chryseobacterium nakagawai]AZA93017.1 hypothetical protein EG343_21645 [Chryseobacterium nakagawai]VEH19647.1 Uncharacterised protein [Chryseobacterium nakagawai]
MKQYLVYINFGSPAKNELEQKLIKFLMEIDRTIIDVKDLKSFKENIIGQIGFINQEFSNDFSKAVSWYNKGAKHKDYGLIGVSCAIVRLYEIKKKYEITKTD